jgi:hypothetical protein
MIAESLKSLDGRKSKIGFARSRLRCMLSREFWKRANLYPGLTDFLKFEVAIAKYENSLFLHQQVYEIRAARRR